MEILETVLPGVSLLCPRRHADARGWFVECYNRRDLAAIGLPADFVQDNVAYSKARFTVRGLHWQQAPRAQTKLVRVLRGRIFDVVVDLRPGSATFGRHAAFELSAQNQEQLFVPAGIAHGYCTLESDCEVSYKVTDYYDPALEAGLFWQDPALGISWPCGAGEAILADKDRRLPGLAEIQKGLQGQ